MRDKLTVGEASKLLNISAHTVRYYIKEHLISPYKDPISEYYYFDYDDIYELNRVMLLRESGIPIKRIRDILKDESTKEYAKALDESMTNVRGEIKRLRALEKELNRLKESLEEFNSGESRFRHVDYGAKDLSIIKSSDYEADYPLKEIYELYKTLDLNMNAIYKDPIVFILRNQTMLYCYEGSSKGETLKIPKGKYLEYVSKISDDNIELAIEEYLTYVHENKMNVIGEMIMEVDTKDAMMHHTEYIIKIRMRLNEKQ